MDMAVPRCNTIARAVAQAGLLDCGAKRKREQLEDPASQREGKRHTAAQRRFGETLSALGLSGGLRERTVGLGAAGLRALTEEDMRRMHFSAEQRERVLAWAGRPSAAMRTTQHILRAANAARRASVFNWSWSELPPEMPLAARLLGYEPGLSQEEIDAPGLSQEEVERMVKEAENVCAWPDNARDKGGWLEWEQLPADQQAAAEVLGLGPETWPPDAPARPSEGADAQGADAQGLGRQIRIAQRQNQGHAAFEAVLGGDGADLRAAAVTPDEEALAMLVTQGGQKLEIDWNASERPDFLLEEGEGSAAEPHATLQLGSAAPAAFSGYALVDASQPQSQAAAGLLALPAPPASEALALAAAGPAYVPRLLLQPHGATGAMTVLPPPAGTAERGMQRESPRPGNYGFYCTPENSSEPARWS